MFEMPGKAPEKIGSLWRLDADLSAHRVVPGIGCSNGLAWSPDSRTMYFTDSHTHYVWAFDFDPASGELRIIVQRGFSDSFLEFFNSVHDGTAACGTALKNGKRVIVENVESDPLYDEESRKVMLAAGALSVQSTPFITRSGRLLGMFSTHYRAPRSFDERNLRLRLDPNVFTGLEIKPARGSLHTFRNLALQGRTCTST